MIAITEVRIGEDAERLMLDVLRSGQLAQGCYVEQFENEFAQLHEIDHAIAVNSGTTALVASLQALGVGHGDEVITSPFTFVATLNAIIEAGATARFADIGEDFNVDPIAIKDEIGTRTKAMLPVHLYGTMADLDPIMGMAADHDLRVIEDAAQAVGASYHGVMAGSADVGCFSLYATKNITTGEGGVITTNDAVLADRLRVLRNQGMRARYEYEVAGHNYRLTNLAAAVGLPQIQRVAEMTASRQRNALLLRDGLGDVPGLVLPPEPGTGRTHVYHQFTARISAEGALSRDAFVAALNDAGVGCGVYYPKVVFDYDCYRSHPQVIVGDVPNAEKAAREVVSLPVHPYLSDADCDRIITVVREVLGA